MESGDNSRSAAGLASQRASTTMLNNQPHYSAALMTQAKLGVARGKCQRGSDVLIFEIWIIGEGYFGA